jgi:conjugative relaxase-like TrwC/TraI family protein
MLSISKALSSGQAQTYHKLEFTSSTQSYYKQDGAGEGEWQGQLAAKMGLSRAVTPEEFTRLTEGKHPETGKELVKHRAAQEYTNPDGTTTKAVEHRAGWDATFSAPKSVSLTALVGGDDRVREAHREAVTAALTELEAYTQARIGGNNAAETTGKFVAAKFEHDTARPVDGYAAPQLHTHVFIMNVTEREDGTTRALQERGMFETQNYATAVYQSVLTYKLRDLGYEIDAGKSGAPEIKGYSQEYLDASSPRSQQIKEHLAKSGHTGAEASQIAAHATRDKKQILSPDEVLQAHRSMATSFGSQPAAVVAEALERARTQERTPDRLSRAREAVTYARSSNFEREAVVDQRTILRDALRRGMGETTFQEVKAEFTARQEQGDFRELKGKKHATGRSFTTPETIANERANIRHVLAGQNSVEPITNREQAEAQAATRAFLNDAQRQVITEVLTSPDRIHGIQGLAGTGKTTVLASIREGAEANGYKVEGFAPTSRAAGQLREEGIEATTLQSFLARGQNHPSATTASRHLFMLDESSLASTKQMRAFLEKLKPEDRVLVIGDTAQHQGVDAGRPFEQMQDAGMRTSQLDQIVRQRKDPALLEAVQHLAKGETVQGIKMLDEQGRITQISDPKERITAIAKDYAAQPENTIIVSPDNRSRQLINEAVRGELQNAGKLATDDQQLSILAHRSDMTGADREWAARYKAGDVLKYETGSKAHGIAKNSIATVLSSDASNNTITIQREDGQAVTYDPKRLKGVNAYRETDKDFSTGDRIQFTAKDKELGVNNRDLGTITKLEPGQITVQMDGKVERIVQFDPAQMRHFDHGYAVTSHVSQGLTEGRVIANIDTDSARSLINTRLAYVSVSRAEYDARIYTNDAEGLGARLATDVSKTSAVDFKRSPQPQSPTNSSAPVYEYADPNHRLAAVAAAYAERPSNTVVIAKDQAEREELNQLIRADLQASGTVAPDSKSFTVHIEQESMNRKRTAEYTPGDIIHYKQGSPSLQGIPNNSAAVVVSTDSASNQLTIKNFHGDEVTYSPHLTPTMTAQSKVYRPEQQEFAQGDRIRVTEPNPAYSIKKGDFGTVTNISEAEGLEVRFDKGPTVQLTKDQAQQVQHGYAVDSLNTGAPERILITQNDPTQAHPEIASLTRTGREVSLYTSDGSVQSPAPSITLPDQLKTSNALPGQPQPSLAMPEQQPNDNPSNTISPQPEPAHHRHSHGR